MNGRARFLFGLGIVCVLAAGGAYMYARYEMAARIRGFATGVTDISYARGGAIPDEESFAASARALAEPLGLTVDSFSVTRGVETGSGDAAGMILNQKLGGRSSVRMELVRYTVRAELRAEKWVFSRRGEIEVDRTYRRSVTLDTGGGDIATPRVPMPDTVQHERGLGI